MKTTKQIRNNRISILFSLTAIIFFPFMSNAQLDLSSGGGIAVGGGAIPATGLNVNAGGILVSGGIAAGGGVAVGGGTAPTTGLNINTGGISVSGGARIGLGTIPTGGLIVNGPVLMGSGTMPTSGLSINGPVLVGSGTLPTSGLNIVGPVSVGGGTMPGSGLLVNSGNINLKAATKAYQINGLNMLWNNNNTANIFVGYNAGSTGVTGVNNAFVGDNAGLANTTGNNNAAFGHYALNANVGGYDNTACGSTALRDNTSGIRNTACGFACLNFNDYGSNNTSIGYASGYNTNSSAGAQNTYIGHIAGYTNTTGSYNTCVGQGADVNNGTLTVATAIGSGAITTATNMMYLGNSSTTIYCALGYFSGSDGRFKTNVTENVQGLAFIKKLRPVTYNMDTKKMDDFLIQNMPDSMKTLHKQGMDFSASTAVVHSGFIAQEVEKAAKDIGFTNSIVNAPANSNSHYGLNYGEFVVPLVKAVQELSKTTDSIITAKTQQDSVVNALNSKIGNLDSTVNSQNAKINNQDSISKAQNAKITELQNQISNCCSNIIGKSFIDNTNSTTTGTNSDGSVNSGTSVTSPILYQNIPNPFNQSTSIQYAIPTTTQSANIMIFDLTGKLIKTIPITTFGNGAITINGNELNAGMFVYSLIVDGKIIDTKRMILTN